jgi:ABC-2 type transport system permease protein
MLALLSLLLFNAARRGLVIPPEFDRDLSRNRTAQVQVLLDGVDANTAGIAGGYIRQIITGV